MGEVEQDDVNEALHGIAMDLPHAAPSETVLTEWGRIDKRVKAVYGEIDRLTGALREAACFCGPVDNPDPTVHREDCAYRVTMERTEAKLEGEDAKD